MFEHTLLLNVLQHPVAALIILVATANAEKPPVVADDCSAKLRDIRFEVNQVF